jgi:hypothetical protein
MQGVTLTKEDIEKLQRGIIISKGIDGEMLVISMED